MSTPDQSNKIAQFIQITQATPVEASAALSAANWDLDSAVTLFFEGQGELDNEQHELSRPQASPPVSSASSSAAPSRSQSQGKSSKRFATLSDLGHSSQAAGGQSDSDDEPEKNWFTGGEKSGLAVHKPNKRDVFASGNKLVEDIIKRSQRQQQEDNSEGESDAEETNHFGGTGHRLGNNEVPSQVINAGPSSNRNRPARVTRTLTFWRDGFSVEDSPLYRYDDPSNIPHLKAIEQGKAPISILNVEYGQGVDVHVIRKLDEDYVAPKRKVGGFHGQGQRLGSPVPGERSKSPTPAAETTARNSAASGVSTLAEPENADAQVQVQLGDGSRHRRRFVSTGPVQQLYDFVDSMSSSQRAYTLQTTFPMKKLEDKDISLKEAGLVGSVVIQRWN
jgi:UBX domain-containing protein 1